MIKFKEYEGKLFLILEEPVPLTADAEVPCLTRLIQDDSRMGMFNRDTKPSRLSDHYLVARIVSNNIVVDDFMESDYNRFEIIGTFVEEGSDKWALYQMMRGNKVRHKFHIMPNTHYAMNEKRQIAIFTTPSSMVYGGYVICHANDWLTSRQVGTMIDERTGWQIYKEPKLTFKVGDWVECFAKQGQRKLVDYFGGMGCYKTNYGEVISPGEILRKLPPSEIIVKIGCLSGTVRPVSTNGIHMWFHLTGIDDRLIATIRISCLDIRTRELVEDLLKAQDEEK